MYVDRENAQRLHSSRRGKPKHVIDDNRQATIIINNPTISQQQIQQAIRNMNQLKAIENKL